MKIKLFEEFMQDGSEMNKIMNKEIERISYWFQNGSFSLSSTPIELSKSTTPNASTRSIITKFADSEFFYHMYVIFHIEDLENCEVIIKKYDPSKIDELNGGEPIDHIDLTNDKQIKVNDLKEDLIMKEIDKMNNKKENPDDNKIEVPKEKQPPQAQAPAAQGTPPTGEVPPPQTQAPVQGGSPPAQNQAGGQTTL